MFLFSVGCLHPDRGSGLRKGDGSIHVCSLIGGNHSLWGIPAHNQHGGPRWGHQTSPSSALLCILQI